MAIELITAHLEGGHTLSLGSGEINRRRMIDDMNDSQIEWLELDDIDGNKLFVRKSSIVAFAITSS